MAHASTFAELVAHVRGGQLARPGYLDRAFVATSDDLVRSCDAWDRSRGVAAPVIDATMVYETYLDRDRIALYEDHPYVKPPWATAWVCYRNDHGNLMVTLVTAIDMPPNWESAENDLSEATTTMVLMTYAGGTNGLGELVPSFGPMRTYRLALDDDGRLLDILWIALDGKIPDQHDPAPDWPLITVLGTYSLLNCTNIEIVPRQFDRPERRRRARAGVGDIVESVIHVKSTARRHVGGAAPAAAAPPSRRLHSVRGAIHHYGACCPTHEPRGLLFGRYSGRVFVPQHARGVAQLGATRQTYVIDKPGEPT